MKLTTKGIEAAADGARYVYMLKRDPGEDLDSCRIIEEFQNPEDCSCCNDGELQVCDTALPEDFTIEQLKERWTIADEGVGPDEQTNVDEVVAQLIDHGLLVA